MKWDADGRGHEKGRESGRGGTEPSEVLLCEAGTEPSETRLCEAGAGFHEEEAKERLGLKDVLAISIAFMQVLFLRVVIVVASFALVIWLLGKFWLKCW